MTQVKPGDTVFVHYTGTLTDGSEFDSSRDRDPLQVTVGAGQLIAGFDAALHGMSLGEKKRVEIPCAEAYGPVDPANRQAVPRAQIPAEIPLEVGLILQMQSPEGQVLPVTVVEIQEDEVVLDANHRLAGKDLIFDIEVVSIQVA